MQTNELLKALGGLSGTRQAQSAATGRPVGGGGAFDDILEQARAGEVTTDMQVRIAKGLDLKLSPDQLRRASAAADVAEANGASRAMILLDGRAYRLDVATRTIIGEAQSARSASMSDVDAVVNAPASDDELAARPVTISPPSSTPVNLANATLRQMLETPD
jgi:hypothetical protein